MNPQLQDDVQSAIARDPRILDPTDIAISADGGIVTLRGNCSKLQAAAGGGRGRQ
jgi:hypothetical protein